MTTHELVKHCLYGLLLALATFGAFQLGASVQVKKTTGKWPKWRDK